MRSVRRFGACRARGRNRSRDHRLARQSLSAGAGQSRVARLSGVSRGRAGRAVSHPHSQSDECARRRGRCRRRAQHHLGRALGARQQRTDVHHRPLGYAGIFGLARQSQRGERVLLHAVEGLLRGSVWRPLRAWRDRRGGVSREGVEALLAGAGTPG